MIGHLKLVSLTPDWTGDFGHFGPLERRLHEVAAAGGDSHIALAGASLSPLADWQVPTFSETTFSVAAGFAPVGALFEGELRAALERVHLPPGSVVFLYTADVWHLAAILEVAAERPSLRFVVNLMRSAGWIGRALDGPDPWIDSLVDLLRSSIAAAAGTNVVVSVDTGALAADVRILTGQEVALWPMITLSRSAGDAQGSPRGDAIHVVAPVQAQSAKGFPDLARLAEKLSKVMERGELRLTARWPADGAHPEILRQAGRVEELGALLVRGNLADAEFAELVASADVVLVPYRVRPFRTRTSAVALDALLAGKPVVAASRTWAGDLVERYGAGLTYRDGDVAAMEGALSQITTRLDAFRRRVATIRQLVEADHAPRRLIDFLHGGSGLKRLHPPALAEVRALVTDTRRRLRTDRATG